MINFPQMNPLRFRVRSFGDGFPTKQITIDEYAIGDVVYDGVYPVNFMPKFPPNVTIQFQFTTSSDIGETSAYLVDSDGNSTAITLTDITPAGWVGDDVLKGSFVASEGCYHVMIVEDIFEDIAISDTFEVSLLTNKDLDITYQNSENDYGMVFFDGATEKFKGNIYVEGQLAELVPNNEISSYTADRGEVVKLRSTPVVEYNMKIFNINLAYLKMLSTVFSCDTITVNGVGFENSDGISSELIEDTDLANATIKLTQKDYNYMWDQ